MYRLTLTDINLNINNAPFLKSPPLARYCRYNLHYYFFLKFTSLSKMTHQLRLRYEGQLLSDGGAYFPFRSILLVLTHDYIITCVYGRVEVKYS